MEAIQQEKGVQCYEITSSKASADATTRCARCVVQARRKGASAVHLLPLFLLSFVLPLSFRGTRLRLETGEKMH